jgi:hypothetical protein
MSLRRSLFAFLCAGLIVCTLFLLGGHLPRLLAELAGVAPRPLEEVLADLDRYYDGQEPPPRR